MRAIIFVQQTTKVSQKKHSAGSTTSMSRCCDETRVSSISDHENCRHARCGPSPSKRREAEDWTLQVLVAKHFTWSLRLLDG